jgi:anti-anti-sigma factor
MSRLSEQISIDLTELDNEVVVTATGELDLRVAEEFDRKVSEAIRSESSVTIDLSRATFIDSAILQVLAKCGKALYDRDERLRVITTPGSHPQYVLDTVGFGTFMDLDTV